MVTSTGSYSATAPISLRTWIMQMVAFRAAGAGFTISASPASLTICARQSGDVDDNHDGERRLQQFRRIVGHRSAGRDNGELQSEHNTGAGFGHIDDDDHGGGQHGTRHLPDYGDRQRRRGTAEYDVHVDGDRSAELQHLSFA